MKKKFGNTIASVEVEATITKPKATAPQPPEPEAAPLIPPVDESKPIPDDATCQEAATGARGLYIPCGAPANKMIRHDKDNRSYFMCETCAEHNIRNRGGKLIMSSKKLTSKLRKSPDEISTIATEPSPSTPIKRADLPLISTLSQPDMDECAAIFQELDRHTYININDNRVRREDRIKQLKAQLADYAIKAKQPGYRHGDLFLTTQHMEGRETLDKGLLMEDGVTAEQIKNGMKRGASYITNVFGRIADKDD